MLWMAGISACIILGVITLASLPWERRNPEAVQNARELKSAIADVRAELDFVPPALRRLGDKIALFEGRFAMAKTTLTPAQLWAVNLLQIDLDRFIPLAGQASKYAAPEIFFYPAAQYRFCVGMTRDSADEAMRRLSEK